MGRVISFIQNYNLDFYINPEESAENLLKSLFVAFRFQKPKQKIYVICLYQKFLNNILPHIMLCGDLNVIKDKKVYRI